ncbi:unnamed protein product [Prorocentrum cordatum]|uniref:Uncharacterized protein n=1 Tax=Prorocentrum cordatum TaxID=2364126 RepID=A0ABN9TWK2_9DINO|nr:unnamed protein product [Polarella glacialis]
MSSSSSRMPCVLHPNKSRFPLHPLWNRLCIGHGSYHFALILDKAAFRSKSTWPTCSVALASVTTRSGLVKRPASYILTAIPFKTASPQTLESTKIFASSSNLPFKVKYS